MLEPRVILRSIGGRTYAHDRSTRRIVDLGPSPGHSTFVTSRDFDAVYEAQVSKPNGPDQTALRKLWDASERPSNNKPTAAPLSKEALQTAATLANRQQRVFGGRLKGKVAGRDVPPPPPTPSGPPTLLELVNHQEAPATLPNLPLPGGEIDAPEIGGFNTGAFGTQTFGHPAPEPVRNSPIAKVALDLGTGPQPPNSAIEQVARDLRTSPIARPFDRTVLTFQVHALIAAFEEIEAYDPKRHHNSGKAPALWSDDPDFRNDIKAVLSELRRLNDLLEAGKEPSPTAARKIGKALTSGASITYKAACGTIGAGLGLVILGSFAEILSQLGLRAELNQILSWAPKLK